ncbi:MAG: RagB/SusD family nutrient uptake outer membrane protein [Cyclobacteriaceae bacterium]
MKRKIVALSIMGLFFTLSCNDDFLTEGNPTAASVGNSFNTPAEADQAVVATYAALQGNDMFGREYWWVWDLLSDELMSGGAILEARRAIILNYNHDASNELVNNVWRGIYRIIHRSNIVINTLPRKEASLGEGQLSQELIDKLTAESRFLRGWMYADLVALWGNVPFTTKPLTTVEGVPKAESVDAIYTQIYSDLDSAIAFLPSKAEDPSGRATSAAAQAMKARILLFQGRYEEARPLLQSIISSGEYRLVDEYVDNHREENELNDESIFEVQFSSSFGNGNQWSGNGDGLKEVGWRGQEYSPVDWHNTVPSDQLLRAYEDGDPRYDYNFLEYGETYGGDADSVFTAASIAQGTTERTVHWFKYGNLYKRLNELFNSGINMRVIRYADVLLMMAEVELEAGNLTQAVDYINQVRARPSVNMPPITASTADDIFDALVRERQVELASEQLRYRDVRRWLNNGKLTENPIAEDIPGGISSTYDFLPLPQQELDYYPALSSDNQNPGC